MAQMSGDSYDNYLAALQAQNPSAPNNVAAAMRAKLGGPDGQRPQPPGTPLSPGAPPVRLLPGFAAGTADVGNGVQMQLRPGDRVVAPNEVTMGGPAAPQGQNNYLQGGPGGILNLPAFAQAQPAAASAPAPAPAPAAAPMAIPAGPAPAGSASAPYPMRTPDQIRALGMQPLPQPQPSPEYLARVARNDEMANHQQQPGGFLLNMFAPSHVPSPISAAGAPADAPAATPADAPAATPAGHAPTATPGVTVPPDHPAHPYFAMQDDDFKKHFMGLNLNDQYKVIGLMQQAAQPNMQNMVTARLLDNIDRGFQEAWTAAGDDPVAKKKAIIAQQQALWPLQSGQYGTMWAYQNQRGMPSE